jgi:hypothetical protein
MGQYIAFNVNYFEGDNIQIKYLVNKVFFQPVLSFNSHTSVSFITFLPDDMFHHKI